MVVYIGTNLLSVVVHGLPEFGQSAKFCIGMVPRAGAKTSQKKNWS